ncbi:helix-turn-helix domain-containing protein [Megamonas hypermegale]|uniref:helix-turn-helix domain-containing protein n=1 Tax=Megamonas hypermegale TaxID=158847 RepID=UPI0026F2CBC5|nr:helix-turn-helix domain-containing protein [Megamonas hypermegale]
MNNQISYSTIISSRLKKALETKNLKQTDLVKLTGLGKSAISQYISGKVTPKQDKISIIAKALNINELWLMGIEDNMYATKADDLPELTAKDERDIKKKLDEAIASLNNKEALMFDGEPVEMDDETRELLKSSLENSIRIAKTLAKKKYTPKKYRKDTENNKD